MSEQSRNEEFREGGNESCLLRAAGWNRKGALGWIPGQTGADPGLEAVEAAAAAGGCTAGSGLLSTGTGGLSAFSGLPSEANSFQPRGDHSTLPWGSSSRLPLVCGPDSDFDRSPFVLGAQEQTPGIVPAGQAPSQRIPRLACPAGVTAHLETIMNLLSSNGCSNHWINFPEFLFSSLCSQVSFN